MSPLDRLSELFRDFPGIGPRQAKRFVYFLLAASPGYRKEIATLIEKMGADVSQCTSCFRYFPQSQSRGPSELCKICNDPARDQSLLMAVERDVDVESVERSGAYKGRYLVLGGLVPLASEEPERFVRLEELLKAASRPGLKEIILGFSATTEGDHTRLIAQEWLKGPEQAGLKISVLGRGLSTGSELEYADPDTIKAAILGKK
jgi:recombination protein RecR